MHPIKNMYGSRDASGSSNGSAPASPLLPSQTKPNDPLRVVPSTPPASSIAQRTRIRTSSATRGPRASTGSTSHVAPNSASTVPSSPAFQSFTTAADRLQEISNRPTTAPDSLRSPPRSSSFGSRQNVPPSTAADPASDALDRSTSSRRRVAPPPLNFSTSSNQASFAASSSMRDLQSLTRSASPEGSFAVERPAAEPSKVDRSRPLPRSESGSLTAPAGLGLGFNMISSTSVDSNLSYLSDVSVDERNVFPASANDERSVSRERDARQRTQTAQSGFSSTPGSPAVVDRSKLIGLGELATPRWTARHNWSKSATHEDSESESRSPPMVRFCSTL